MGSIPYRMCKKNLEYKVYWGLFDKISPAFELRNSGAPAVVLRPFQLRAIERGHSRDCVDCQPPLYQRYCRPPPPGSPLPIIASYTYLLKGLKCSGYIYTTLCTVPRPILT
jgi:hypothetical protein